MNRILLILLCFICLATRAHEKRDSFTLYFHEHSMAITLFAKQRTDQYICVVHGTLSIYNITTTYRDTIVPCKDSSDAKIYYNDSAKIFMTLQHDILEKARRELFNTRMSNEDINLIISLLDMSKDSSTWIYEPMHGGTAQYLTVTARGHKTEYSMWNKGDSTAFKVYQVLNKYLPEDYMIHSLELDWDAFFDSLFKTSLGRTTPEDSDSTSSP